KGTLAHVEDRAAHDLLAVFRYIKDLFLRRPAGRSNYANLLEVSEFRGFGVADCYLNLWSPDKEMANVFFHGGLVKRRFFPSVRRLCGCLSRKPGGGSKAQNCRRGQQR